MNNVRLMVQKHNNTSNAFYVEDYCTSIKLSNNINQISAELSFSMPYATISDNLLPLNIEMGDIVTLTCIYYKIEIQIFCGKVTDTGLKGKAQELNVTCYDYTWWLCKSNITKNFDNISVYSALEYIYKFIGAVYEDIDKELGEHSNIKIGSHLVKKKPASKVIYAIYNEVTKVTQALYYMHATGDGSTITVTECDKYFSGLTIQPAFENSKGEIEGNLIDYEIKNSMQNMVTRVDFFDTTGKEFSNIGEGGSIELPNTDIGRYGTIIENIEVDSADTTGQLALAKGNKILSEKGKPEIDITVTCIGDLKYKVGYGVVTKIPNTDYYDICMYIISSEWIWNKDESFISKLGLSTSKYTNSTEWADIEEKDTTNSTTGYSNGAASNLVEQILVELKKYLGLAYVWGGQSPAAGGMDCSGYISYVYNQFSDQLEITSNDGKFHPPTQSMIDQGKDVTSDFPNNLRQCDIIFPHTGHVVAYIGNNQVIHEPQTGDVCKVSDIWFDNPAKVIRVVPDSAWITSSNNSGTSDGSVSDNLVEFVKGWEKFFANAYDDGYGNMTIGYGTTAKDKVALGTCTESEATQWLKDELNYCASSVKNKLDSLSINLPQNRFDCLCDMAYNLGSSGFSGFYDLLSSQASDDDIRNKLMNYNHASGQVSSGLTKRCEARVKMWFDGVYDSSH